MRQRHNQGGFTLWEVVTIIVIVCILLAILLPLVQVAPARRLAVSSAKGTCDRSVSAC